MLNQYIQGWKENKIIEFHRRQQENLLAIMRAGWNASQSNPCKHKTVIGFECQDCYMDFS